MNIVKTYKKVDDSDASEDPSLLSLGVSSGEIAAPHEFTYRAFCVNCDIELSIDAAVNPAIFSALQSVEAAKESSYIAPLTVDAFEDKPGKL
jgi:hypothetical protein